MTKFKWFDIKKCKPNNGQQVLIKHKNGVSEADYLFSPENGYTEPTFLEPYYGQDFCHFFEDVTKWAPMPE